MDTHQIKTMPRGPVVLADPVWHALSSCSAFYSSTPAAFDAKTGHFPPAAKDDTAVIIIDVLRATSTLIAVAAAGAAGIHVGIKQKNGAPSFTPPTQNIGPWVYGGEENGRAIAGGCIANSPIEVTEALFSGAYLKFVSTNGARAITAAEDAGFSRLYLACLPNITATVAQAIEDGASRVIFAAGGFYGSSTLEDTVCAGLGVEALLELRFTSCAKLDDEVRAAFDTAPRYRDPTRFVQTLSMSQVGRLLTEIGRGADVAAVVTGAGIEPTVWTRMATTVLRYTSIDGIGVFMTPPSKLILQ